MNHEYTYEVKTGLHTETFCPVTLQKGVGEYPHKKGDIVTINGKQYKVFTINRALLDFRNAVFYYHQYVWVDPV